VALWEGFLSAACAWRVLGEGRRTGVHSLCEGGGLVACGDDVAQDLQLRRSRSHRRADAQLAFLPSSSRTSIPTTLIPLRPCPPVDPVGIFPLALPATAGLHVSSPITSIRPLLCRDHARRSQAHSHRDSDWRYAFSSFISFSVSPTTRSALLCMPRTMYSCIRSLPLGSLPVPSSSRDGISNNVGSHLLIHDD